ncbi:o-succinylbenzoate synthase [Staphylococcus auricularis]|uniref:o-succinylbenzoate synthase n=1 Tax=Staphylococcus auricularis TaxID=29379 RepID=A0AAW7MC08_9STAP|nr:o-succinylbenzoate synthase [Staphylococcus auricularis]MDC6326998.1 o-succinylbenzoate synthase [Staphylococcus auricularis]MDN4532875.1 o-succinylbenzoate synthase [Staphylococcus auricularis]
MIHTLKALHFYQYSEPFKETITTPKVTLTEREVLVIGIETEEAQYFGECNAFSTAWYDVVTINDVITHLKDWFQNVKGATVATFEAAQRLADELNDCPTARSTVIMALYQMFYPLKSLSVDYGATVSGMSQSKLEQLNQTAPKRVKLKWSADVLDDIRAVQGLSFSPSIALDANESLTFQDMTLLKQLEQDTILYLEEPFIDFQNELIEEAAAYVLIAIDEKATSEADIMHLVKQYPIDTVILKPFRLGGIDKVYTVMKQLQQRGLHVVVGGMYEFGLSRYFTALIARFGDFPGDVTPDGYYFEQDFVPQSGILKGGSILFEPPRVEAERLTLIDSIF